jgi:hypothetical protein
VLCGQRPGIVFLDIEFVEAEIKLSAARLAETYGPAHKLRCQTNARCSNLKIRRVNTE